MKKMDLFQPNESSCKYKAAVGDEPSNLKVTMLAPSWEHITIQKTCAFMLDKIIVAKGFKGCKSYIEGHIARCGYDLRPDVMYICSKNPEYPDLIIEVLSASTAIKDLEENPFVYKELGVKEYWVVSPMRRTVKVHDFSDKEPITYTDKTSFYSSVLDCRIKVSDLFEEDYFKIELLL